MEWKEFKSMAIGENIKNRFLWVPYVFTPVNVYRDTLFLGNMSRSFDYLDPDECKIRNGNGS